MKNLLTLTALLALLAGCAKEEVSVAAVEEPAAEPSNMLVEYMWCKAGENYSQENHMALNADWNAREAASQHQTSGAFWLIQKSPTTITMASGPMFGPARKHVMRVGRSGLKMKLLILPPSMMLL